MLFDLPAVGGWVLGIVGFFRAGCVLAELLASRCAIEVPEALAAMRNSPFRPSEPIAPPSPPEPEQVGAPVAR